MNINSIYNTCSMAELGDVDYYKLMEYDKEGLKKLVLNDDEDVKAIIFNCTFSKSKRQDIIDKFGFEEVFKYDGNEDKVHVLMLELSDL